MSAEVVEMQSEVQTPTGLRPPPPFGEHKWGRKTKRQAQRRLANISVEPVLFHGYAQFSIKGNSPTPRHAGIQLKSLVVQMLEQALVTSFPVRQHLQYLFRLALGFAGSQRIEF